MERVVAPHIFVELTGGVQHWSKLHVPRPRSRAQRVVGHAVAGSAKIARRAVTAAGLFLVLTSPVAFQDIRDLVAAREDAAPRWTARLVSTPGESDKAPTFAFRTDEGPKLTLAGGAAPLQVTGVVASDKVADADLPIDRSRKGERLITQLARTGDGEIAAGTLYRVSSLYGSLADDSAPRAAFIRTRPVPQDDPKAYLALRTDEREDLQISGIDRQKRIAARAVAAASASIASAYASDSGFDVEAPFRSLLGETGLEPPDEEVVTPEELAIDPHAWINNPLPISAVRASEQRCLAEAVYFEAATEPFDGQVGVAQVVLNRVRNPVFPKTICGVVYQNKEMRNRCQFSFACDLNPDRVADNAAWRQAQFIAREVTAGRLKVPELVTVTHYHADYVHPRWADLMKRQKQIGRHIFYQTYGGGWS